MADEFDETDPLLQRERLTSSVDSVIRPSAASHPPLAYSRSKWKRHGACGAILLAVMLERLTFYGFSTNLVLFLNERPLNWLSYDAANAAFIFAGLAYVSPVLGGLLADTLLGRFKTVVLGFAVYILGGALLVFLGYTTVHDRLLVDFCGYNITEWVNVTIDTTDSAPTEIIHVHLNCTWAVYVSLLIIAIAAGAIKANLSPFGGDQVRYEGPEVMRTFFHWYYWAINVGTLIALAGVTLLQQNLNFYVGLLVPAAVLCLATAIFIVGRTWYLSKKPTGSVLTNTSKILVEAFRRQKVRRMLYNQNDSQELFASQPTPSFLDMAKVRFGGSFHESLVEDVKSLKKIILVFVGLIPYWVLYFQMQTTFLLQGLHMRFETNSSMNDSNTKFQIPPAWLSLFDVVAVLLLLPLFDFVLYPRLDRRGYNFSLLRRMILGMLFSTLAVACAGVLETVRRDWVEDHPNSLLNQTVQTGGITTVYNAADIWVFYQVPQYTLIGISEVFASVAGLEFAYSMAPRSMQGLIMGIFCMSMGLGAFIGTGLLHVGAMVGWLKPEDNGNINNGHLDWYFYMLTAIQLVATAVFAAVALLHERREARQQASLVVINKGPGESSRPTSGT